MTVVFIYSNSLWQYSAFWGTGKRSDGLEKPKITQTWLFSSKCVKGFGRVWKNWWKNFRFST